MKKLIALIALALLSVHVFATAPSMNVVKLAQEAISKTADQYFGEGTFVAFDKITYENGVATEVFYTAFWSETTTDLSYDEGEPVFFPYVSECEQQFVYIVETGKVLLTTQGYCN